MTEGTVACDNCPVPIPDETTVIGTLTVAGFTGTISDVNVTVDISHTSNRDLQLFLQSPNGTTITLADQVCTFFQDDLDATFDDQAATPIGTVCPPNGGTFYPSPGTLSTFRGENPNGVWTLTVADVEALDEGILNDWSLEITTTTVPFPPNNECVYCPVGIPDESTAMATFIVAGQPGSITDVNVDLDITHTWIGDLDVTLTSPMGTVVTLFTDICDSIPGSEDMLVTLDDSAATAIEAAPCPAVFPPGTYRPETPALLSDFNGENPNGVWTLTVVDDNDADVGRINDWSLDITTT
jgi:subtilisin-like proprotein convertase family protein